jgi:hypothetical protein
MWIRTALIASIFGKEKLINDHYAWHAQNRW